MKLDQARAEFISWARTYYNENFISGSEGSISCRIGDTMLITPRRKSPATLTPEDVILIDIPGGSMSSGANPPADMSLHRAVYRKFKETGAIVHTVEPNTMTSSRAGKTVYPLLDDLAQIVGPTTRVARYSEPVDAGIRASVVKGLKKRSAVLLSGGGALCMGANLDEAHAVCQVLMKGCKCFIETEFLGGGIRINPVETRLMRLVYLIKYSKQNVKNR